MGKQYKTRKQIHPLLPHEATHLAAESGQGLIPEHLSLVSEETERHHGAIPLAAVPARLRHGDLWRPVSGGWSRSISTKTQRLSREVAEHKHAARLDGQRLKVHTAVSGERYRSLRLYSFA